MHAAGQMAEALARGFIDKGVVKAADVHCTDPVQARREVFESFGAQSQSTTVDVSPAVLLCLTVIRLNVPLELLKQPFMLIM